jgi:hypothetical protein
MRRSRGLGDVYKRQSSPSTVTLIGLIFDAAGVAVLLAEVGAVGAVAAELFPPVLAIFNSAANAILRSANSANSALVKILGRTFGATDFAGIFFAGAFTTFFATDLTAAFFAGAFTTFFATDLTAVFFAGAAFLAGLEDGT